MTLAMWLLCAKANACMPFSPEDVFIARYQGAQAMQAKPANFEVQLSSDQFVFRSLYDWFRYDNATQWYSLFSTQHIAKNSLIIGLAYAPDEKKTKQYQVVSFAKLGCKNNHLEIFGRLDRHIYFGLQHHKLLQHLDLWCHFYKNLKPG